MARTPPELEETLLRIIEEHEVRDQETLLHALREAGIDVSQPTLSRHLRRLNVVKRHGRYVVGVGNPFRAPPCSVREAPPNLLILKTLPGRAQLLAVLIDQAHFAEVGGTMAGDDTVFVAIAANSTLAGARAALNEILAPADDT